MENVTTSEAPELRTEINRSSGIPLYVQLKQALSEQIESGSWKPKERIPGEAELCDLFSVSRTVVRQALKDMAHEGLVVREKGRGTFVAEPKISSKSLVHSLAGFYEDMVERGLEPVADVLEQALLPATAAIAEKLKLDVLTPVVKIVRLRYVQNEPIVLVTSYLPYDRCRALVNADLTRQSLYAFLEAKCGLQVFSGHRLIDAVLADEYEAKLLQIEPGSPLLRLDSVSYLWDGTPLEYFHGVFRSDRACFEVEIDRIRE